MTDFSMLPKGHFGAILADPPWTFKLWSPEKSDKAHGCAAAHYPTMSMREIARLPVEELAADNCVLFMWACWPSINDALKIIDAWGFEYKTCAFNWLKADPYRLFALEEDVYMASVTGREPTPNHACSPLKASQNA